MKELWAGNKSMSVADEGWGKMNWARGFRLGSYKGGLFESGKRAVLNPNNRILRAAMME